MSQNDNNSTAAATTLPFQALQRIVSFGCDTPTEALVLIGSVCSHWRENVKSFTSFWNEAVRSRWAGVNFQFSTSVSAIQTESSGECFDVFMERMKRVYELKPIKSHNTTAIEDCDFAFRCPMLVENLQLVQPAVAGLAGPIYYCDVCSQCVYTVRTQEEKEKCASENKCVVFHRKNVQTGASVRVRVACVTKDKEDGDDEQEEDSTAAAVSSCSSNSQQKQKQQDPRIHQALCSIRAAIDMMNGDQATSVSVRDRLIVEVEKKSTVAEFRHIYEKDLIASKHQAIAANSNSNNNNRPFVPDVILHFDKKVDEVTDMYESDKHCGISFGHSSIVIVGKDHQGNRVCPNPLYGDETTPLAFYFDIDEFLKKEQEQEQKTTETTSSSSSSSSSNSSSDFWHFGFRAVSGRKEYPEYFFQEGLLQLLLISSEKDLSRFASRYTRFLRSPSGEKRFEGESGLFVSYIEKQQQQKIQEKKKEQQQLQYDDELLDEKAHNLIVEVVKEGKTISQISTFELRQKIFSFAYETYVSEFCHTNNASSLKNNNNTEEQKNQKTINVVVSFPESLYRHFYVDSKISEILKKQAKSLKMNIIRSIYKASAVLSAYEIPFHQSSSSDEEKMLVIHCGNSCFEVCLYNVDEGIMEKLEYFSSTYSFEKNAIKNTNTESSSSSLDPCCFIDTEGNLPYFGASAAVKRPSNNGSYTSHSPCLKNQKDFFPCGNLFDEKLMQLCFEFIESDEKNGGNKNIVEAIKNSSSSNNNKSYHRLFQACSRARLSLSNNNNNNSTLFATIEVDGLYYDHEKDLCYDLSCTISRSKFESLCLPEITNATTQITKLLQNYCVVHGTSSSGAPDDKLLRVVVLSGNVTMMPRFQQMLTQNVPFISQSNGKVQLSKSIRPTIAAGYGDAYWCWQLSGKSKKKIIRPIVARYRSAEHALNLVRLSAQPDESDDNFLMGLLDVIVLTMSVGDAENGTVFKVLERNRIFPVKKTITIKGRNCFDVVASSSTSSVVPQNRQTATSKEKETIMTSAIQIYEGERAKFADNNHLATIILPQKVSNPDSNVLVTLDLDPNAILNCSAEEEGNPINYGSCQVTNDDKGFLGKDEIEKMIDDAERFKAQDEELRRRVESKNKLECYCYEMKNFMIECKKKLEGNEKKKTITITTEQLEQTNRLIESGIDFVDDEETTKKASRDDYERKLNLLTSEISKVIPELVEQLFPEKTAQETKNNMMMSSGMPGGGKLPAAVSYQPQIEEVD